jgi:hypothetical protein
LGPDNVGFDHQIIRTTDHDEMFDMIPTDDDELAVTVEVKSIVNAKAAASRGLDTPAPCSHGQGNHQTNHANRDENGDKRAEPTIEQRAQRHAQLFSKGTGARPTPTWSLD